jgi:DNA-binding transcriptional regulator GbsR (MarR family)
MCQFFEWYDELGMEIQKTVIARLKMNIEEHKHEIEGHKKRVEEQKNKIEGQTKKIEDQRKKIAELRKKNEFLVCCLVFVVLLIMGLLFAYVTK